MAKKPSKTPHVSIFIPTYNGEDYIEDLLNAVFSQEVDFDYEVLVTDSGSKDNTVEIVKQFPSVKFDTIPNSEFGHGRTRNRAARKANGEFMVFLSQDAVPKHNKWLEYMIEPFAISDKVQGVVGKQVPRPIADITTKREVNAVFKGLGPDHSIMLHRKQSLISDNVFAPTVTFFSDVNSAVRRDFLVNTLPYRDVKYSEDQLFGQDITDAGYIKVYSTYGTVWHSNEYKASEYFNRKVDENMGMYSALGVLPPSNPLWHIRGFFVGTLKDMVATVVDKEYSWKRKLYNLATCPIRNFGRHRAMMLVSNERKRQSIASKYSLERKKTAD